MNGRVENVACWMGKQASLGNLSLALSAPATFGVYPSQLGERYFSLLERNNFLTRVWVVEEKHERNRRRWPDAPFERWWFEVKRSCTDAYDILPSRTWRLAIICPRMIITTFLKHLPRRVPWGRWAWPLMFRVVFEWFQIQPLGLQPQTGEGSGIIKDTPSSQHSPFEDVSTDSHSNPEEMEFDSYSSAMQCFLYPLF